MVPAGLTAVDVDDVAAAHVLAALLPDARGRYLLSERAVLMTEIAAVLRWGEQGGARASGVCGLLHCCHHRGCRCVGSASMQPGQSPPSPF